MECGIFVKVGYNGYTVGIVVMGWCAVVMKWEIMAMESGIVANWL